MTSTEMPGQQEPAYAGFWRRLAAWMLDGLFLGAVGWILGLLMTDHLVALGGWGRLLGLIVAVTYFAMLDSHLGQGQSLGKRVMMIRVLGTSGQLLSPWQAGLRSVTVQLPYFLNGANFSLSWLNAWVVDPLWVLIIGIPLCQLFLSAFNRPSRQLIHDLLSQTVVVASEHRGAVRPSPLSGLQRLVCATLLALPAFVPLAAGMWTDLDKGDWKVLGPMHQAVLALPGVTQAQVGMGDGFRQTTQTGRTTWTYVSVRAYSRTSDIQNPSRLQAIALAILQAYPEGQQRDVLSVSLCHGYDIGIAAHENCEQRNASPAEWLAGS